MSALKLPPLPDLQACRNRIRSTPTYRVTGRVCGIVGATVVVEGMTAAIGAICRIDVAGEAPSIARVIGFSGVQPILAPLTDSKAFAAGDRVELISQALRVPVGPAMLGRVVDALGRPIDGKPLPKGLSLIDVDRPAPLSLDRPPINQPLETGVKAIDALLTIGQGQRVGIFAGSGVGKSTLLGMLARGTKADAIVIAMVGERGREVREFIERTLGKDGVKRSVMVVATSDQPASLRMQAAWTATAIAEAIRDTGKHVLLLVDSVTRFAMAQRELSLAAGEPPTTRGYTPSVFASMPRLVERAGRTEAGAITAFYSVLVEGDDNNEPIADTMRGLLDGHFVLSRALAGESHWPAIDVLHSLSRLQPHLVTPAVKSAADQLRRHLSEYQKHADLISIGAYRSGTNLSLDRAIAMREPARALLTQRSDELMPMSQTHAILTSLAQPSEPPAMATSGAGS
ncbi:MAG: FliI/YscN family ATPase [Planctomycetaceae bacterium]